MCVNSRVRRTLTVSYSVLTSAISNGINTEIFTGAPYYYPSGFNVVWSPVALATITQDAANNRVYVTHTTQAADGDVITISLTPA
jgi:hypothetical protein